MARTGKIARLQKVHRDKINQMLQDGASADRVIRFVATLADAGEKDANDLPIPALKDMNVTNWREGGHQDWLRERARIAGKRAQNEFSIELVRACEGSKIPEAVLLTAAGQISELFDDVDLLGIKDALSKKPELYFELQRAASRLVKPALDLEKYKDRLAEKMLDKATLRKAAEIAGSKLSNREKIAAMRKAAFADVDALQASGEIKLPG